MKRYSDRALPTLVVAASLIGISTLGATALAEPANKPPEQQILDLLKSISQDPVVQKKALQDAQGLLDPAHSDILNQFHDMITDVLKQARQQNPEISLDGLKTKARDQFTKLVQLFLKNSNPLGDGDSKLADALAEDVFKSPSQVAQPAPAPAGPTNLAPGVPAPPAPAPIPGSTFPPLITGSVPAQLQQYLEDKKHDIILAFVDNFKTNPANSDLEKILDQAIQEKPKGGPAGGKFTKGPTFLDT